MERKTNRDINIDWKVALVTWQNLPDHPAHSQRINDLITRTCEMGAGLILKIRPEEIFKNSETRRSVHLDDLKSLFMLEDNFLVAKLKVKEVGKYKMFAMDDYLILADNKQGSMVPFAFFRPQEVESFEVI